MVRNVFGIFPLVNTYLMFLSCWIVEDGNQIFRLVNKSIQNLWFNDSNCLGLNLKKCQFKNGRDIFFQFHKDLFGKKNVQSSLCVTATIGTQNMWLLLTGDRCSEIGFCYKDANLDSKIVVAVGRWSLAQV
jgi:hypothetical protein